MLSRKRSLSPLFPCRPLYVPCVKNPCHEIKPKIKNLDPNTLHERIFEHAEDENVYLFAPGNDIIIDDH